MFISILYKEFLINVNSSIYLDVISYFIQPIEQYNPINDSGFEVDNSLTIDDTGKWFFLFFTK